ncbi:MAG: zinc ABC transporter substrate-binding protein [Proteobacteria bacterium]|nr:zinc ABC transporter substrate-binding protein [Pseudomonadota bacterium]
MNLINNKRLLPLLALISIIFLLSSVSCKIKTTDSSGEKRLNITVTVFPIYDFVRNIGQDKVNVVTILPPGVEAHSFEPRPEDIIKINNSDMFIFLNRDMEVWAKNIIKGLDNKNLLVKEAGQYIILDKAVIEDNNKKLDPHIWLDFERAKRMVDNIATALTELDRKNSSFYLKNAKLYKKKLEDLDKKYIETLKNCKTRYIIHAGHYTFGYLARRYNLGYVSVYKGVSPDEEPTPSTLAKIVQNIKKLNLRYIFYEDFISPKIAEVISKETGVKLLKISGGHNITKEDFENGVSFIYLMERNLDSLKEGLECQ